ncbi:Kynurenine formamidase [Elasticomyces elasticus]|uniref:Kynurenine formamidase n=1 Tax=Exophiala sideris TaxID=1016849 RepID=A0ABR0J8S9_9EURO|nr:Kynurenine formamidase [Elasticomyces elasticus]KAK5027946.1 Kynurenine formamidase [Exophiala sideris]KAK5037463.1 Kynurenine formamidase [Exophiala sideris]KAK5059124.1 Kynurenine formamidase [Exophiala sideris]KAK5182958.1 Kynurenine formamidase [Eurotiomycetes sp. CCFEE 6388]
MKRIIKYLQDQALSASQGKYNGSAYLSPPTKEPQQRVRHRSQSQKNKEQHSAANNSPPAYTATAQGAMPNMSNDIQTRITRHQYAQDNMLQSYDLYIPENVPDQGYWIIYIHGGYFRDPNVTSTSFLPALSLLASSSAADQVVGYASLNYRLSRHEQYPQKETTTPAYELRNALWPDHLNDVRDAIAHLQRKYSFGSKYLLVGHSVGATMALFSTLATEVPSPSITPPVAVLGVSGIYEFEALHVSYPAYVEVTRNAIPNPQHEVAASPAGYATSEFRTKAIILAHSRDDGLVDWRQVDLMRVLFEQTPREDRAVSLRVVEIHGMHNEIWEKGTELARAIKEALAEIQKIDESR